MKLRYFQLAKKLSEKSNYHHKLGAVIVKKNKVIGIGWNNPYKTHTKSNHPYKTIHSELAAMLGVDSKDLKGSTIYVYREGKDGKPILARPCVHCMELIRLANIKEICYTGNGDYKKEYV